MIGKFISPIVSGGGVPDFSEEVYLGGAFTATSPMDYYPASLILTLNDDATVNGRFEGTESLFRNFSTSSVYTIAMQSDGKILTGGSYLFNRVYRFNSDGSEDTSFISGSNNGGSIRKIVVQSDGKILVGGDFTSYTSQARNRFIRLNTDGSIDTSFSIGTGFTSEIFDIAIQSDGKILVAGAFLSYNGITVNRIVRLESNGDIDTTFVTGTAFNGVVRCLKLQPDGKILAGGDFTSYDGTSSNRIIRLDSNGTVDATFSIGTGFSNSVYDVELDSSGNVFACGDFTGFDSVFGRNRLAKLSSTGTLDTSFILGNGFNNRVRRVYLNADGSIYVLGNFTTYKNTIFRGAVRLFNNGDLDYNFNTSFGVTSSIASSNELGVHDIVITSDDKIVLAGSIYGYKGQENTYVVAMNKSADVNQLIRNKLITQLFSNGSVSDILIQPDGRVVISGSYSPKMKRFDKNWNSDGSFSVSFNSGTTIGPSKTQIDSLGRITMIGNFLTVNTVSSNFIARVLKDGSLDTSFVVGTGFSSTPLALKLQVDGKLLVGGFGSSTYNGQASRGLIRLNDDGSIDNTFLNTTGSLSRVIAIHVQSDGKILVGGDFTSYNGVDISPSDSLIRLNPDGTRDMTFVAPNVRLTYDIIETSDGKILVAGTSNVGVIKLNQDGSIDTSFTSNFNLGPSDSISVMVEFSDGKIACGGLFGSIENKLCRNFVILNPNGSFTNIESGANYEVNALALKN